METQAEVIIPTSDFAADLEALGNQGFQLRTIFPADEPRVAHLNGHGIALRLDSTANAGAPIMQIPGVAAPVELSSGATLIPPVGDFEDCDLDDAYVFTSGGDWGEGRAGMAYRDLIPERHGGRVIASHIRITEPGPVPDYVHHHDIRFQMIYCRRGRVEVIYEDQGDAFWMEAGDCVLQPPHIRHRVLASDGGCEVVEIASPAEHPTFVEHEITLPTGVVDAERDFGGQRFSFDRGGDLPWTPVDAGWEAQENGISRATNELAAVRVLRPMGTGPMNDRSRGQAPSISVRSHGDLCLLFVLQGTASVRTAAGHQPVVVDDSIAVKGGDTWTIDETSADFECLHVVLAGSDT